MIYLDNQATTPLAPEALEAMLPHLGGPDSTGFANPASAHKMGRSANAAVEIAREQVLSLLPKGGRLIFTSGATEAIYLGMLSVKQGAAAISAIEHNAVHTAAKARGATVYEIAVDAHGRVDPAEPLSDGIGVVAVMQVNNEIGTIQPVDAIARAAHDAGSLFFCDAVQGVGKIAAPEGADMIALSAHKMYGPKGIGALWVRDGVEISPLFHGDGQEGGMRAGTLSPALCAGFGAAAALAKGRMEADFQHLCGLYGTSKTILKDWQINGGEDNRWPGNLNIRFDGLDAARLMSDLRHIAFSLGSACASGSGKPSHVLAAIGLDKAQAQSSFRLGFGRYTALEDVKEACQLIDKAAKEQF